MFGHSTAAKPRRSAFTLIELIVVIEIIAILAAILFPVFASAREKARQATCTSNVRQVGMAWLQYIQDYDEQYPPRNAITKPDGTASTDYALQPQPAAGAFPCKPCRMQDLKTSKPFDASAFAMPYVKSTGMFHCPSDTGISGVPAEPTGGKPVWQMEGTSYCLNTVVTRVGSPAAIPYPADTYLGAEVYSWHYQSSNASNLWSTRSGAPTRVTYFCDGHVKSVGESYIAQQCSPPAMFQDTASGPHTLTPVP